MNKEINIESLIDNMANEIRTHCEDLKYKKPLMIGIQRGGVWVATRLHHKLGYKDPLGELNIAFYRDDFSKIGVHPEVKPSKLSTNIDIRDQIYTGYVFDKKDTEYYTYLPDFQLFKVFTIDKTLEINKHYNFKIFIFLDEDDLRHKIKIELQTM